MLFRSIYHSTCAAFRQDAWFDVHEDGPLSILERIFGRLFIEVPLPALSVVASDGVAGGIVD